jgi:hypothetical protein
MEGMLIHTDKHMNDGKLRGDFATTQICPKESRNVPRNLPTFKQNSRK